MTSGLHPESSGWSGHWFLGFWLMGWRQGWKQRRSPRTPKEILIWPSSFFEPTPRVGYVQKPSSKRQAKTDLANSKTMITLFRAVSRETWIFGRSIQWSLFILSATDVWNLLNIECCWEIGKCLRLYHARCPHAHFVEDQVGPAKTNSFIVQLPRLHRSP